MENKERSAAVHEIHKWVFEQCQIPTIVLDDQVNNNLMILTPKGEVILEVRGNV